MTLILNKGGWSDISPLHRRVSLRFKYWDIIFVTNWYILLSQYAKLQDFFNIEINLKKKVQVFIHFFRHCMCSCCYCSFSPHPSSSSSSSSSLTSSFLFSRLFFFPISSLPGPLATYSSYYHLYSWKLCCEKICWWFSSKGHQSDYPELGDRSETRHTLGCLMWIRMTALWLPRSIKYSYVFYFHSYNFLCL